MKRAAVLTIDFEGYVEAMAESFSIDDGYPRFDIADELDRNCDACLEALTERGLRATFFVLGWIGERYPEIVHRIAEAGHEIGSHSFHHRRLWGLSAPERSSQIRLSRQALEAAGGKPVRGFRAPDFSLPDGDAFFDDLRDAGYLYDASLNPTNLHDVYGRAGGAPGVHRLRAGLWEVPASNLRFGSLSITVGGGGYLRLFPWWITRRGLDRARDPMVFVHPYEISGHHPRPPMSALRRFRHTFGNGRLDRKLDLLTECFRPLPVIDYLREAGHVH